MSTPLVLEIFARSTGFGYSTRVFSVVRDAGTVVKNATRKQIDTQEVIHPSHLAPLGAFKQEAFRLCRSYGTKMDLFNLWIVPKDDEEALDKGLLDINSRWDAFVHDELLPNYVSWVEKYATDNPSFSKDILRLAPTLEQVKNSTKFSFGRLSLAKAEVHAVNLEEEVEGLWGQVLKEIASDIKDAKMDKSKSYTQAARSVIARITHKCDGLGFLHPRLAEVSKMLEELSGSLPPTGAIKGTEALAVKQVLEVLLNPAKFMRDGFGIGLYQTTLELEPTAMPTTDQPEVISIAGPSPETPPSGASADEQNAADEVVDQDLSLDDILGPASLSHAEAELDIDSDVEPEEAAAHTASPSVSTLPIKSLAPEPEKVLAGISTDFDGW
jgi:hypothetical protein